jgi:anti-sigma B factor antagonist
MPSAGQISLSGGPVLLSLDTRGVGKVTVVRCSGRIVAGNETESLRSHITGMMLEHKEFVLDLGEVAFIDSSGLGTMVRLLTSTRQQRGDLKLCNVPQLIHNALKTTNLTTLFETHGSEESAIAAFYLRKSAPEQAKASGPVVFCIDQNTDVLAYLRELLRRGGYDVHTSCSLRDALILMRVTCPALVLLGPNVKAAPGIQQSFQAACTNLAVIELGLEFSTLDAGEAAAQLLETMQLRLQPHPRLDS